MASFLQIFRPRIFTPFHSLHSHYMPCPSPYRLFDNPNTNLKGTHHVGGLYRDRNMSLEYKRVGALIVATIYLQLIQNRYMFRSFIVLHCNHQHCVQPVASDVEVVGYI